MTSSTPSFSFVNKNILLGISGSIAAYKSCELLRMFQTSGANTRVIMTKQAMEFITPLTLQALSGNEVHIGLVDYEEEKAMGHINLARWADLLLVAPASASLLARLAGGDASDLLAAVFLATSAPRLIAPAMNKEMWLKQETQANLARLSRSPQTHLVQPAEGWQACGEVGPGRLADPSTIVAKAASLFESGLLRDQQVLITAGPTREPLDDMRFLSNYSSGKMSYALASAAVEAGAQTTLVSGPVHLLPPDHCQLIQIETAEQMLAACLARAAKTDIFIAAAAVVDFSPAHRAKGKPAKEDISTSLELKLNDDILVAMKKGSKAKTIGFAAEVDDLAKKGAKKLKDKNLDMLCVNNLVQAYGADDNEVLLLFGDGSPQRNLARASKTTIARQIIEEIARL